jgi:hypothetical protein
MQYRLLTNIYTLNYPAAFWNFNIYTKQLLKGLSNKLKVHLQAGLINGSSLKAHTE